MLWICPGEETEDLERKCRYEKIYATLFLQYFLRELIGNKKARIN